MISKDDLLEALKGLTPEQLSGILAQGHGRSPIKPRQLHDLRKLPTATDPRPTFFLDTDGREFEPITHSPFPRLFWLKDTGQEVTIHSADELDAKRHLLLDAAPNTAVLDPTERARQMFEALSSEDQALVLEAQRQARLAKVNAAMAGLSETQVAQAMANVPTPKARKGA